MTSENSPGCICNQVLGTRHESCESNLESLCNARRFVSDQPAYRWNGREITREEALQVADSILKKSSYPLITGLEQIGIRNQRLAIEIAKTTGAIVDSQLHGNGNESIQTLAREGAVRASLGEIVRRSDYVIFINSPLWESHPRIFKLLTQSSKKRRLCWLGAPEQDHPLDEYIGIAPDQLESFLVVLESKLAGTPFRNDLATAIDIRTHLEASSSEETATSWLNEITASKYVTIFYSLDESSVSFSTMTDQIVSISKLLQKHCRAIAIEIGSSLAASAHHTLTWSTGYPEAVDLSGAVSKSFFNEYKSSWVLDRNECDSAMIFGDVGFDKIESSRARKHLKDIAKIHFCWSDSSDDIDNALTIANLDLADDFVRFDELVFGLDSKLRALPLEQFLADLVQNF